MAQDSSYLSANLFLSLLLPAQTFLSQIWIFDKIFYFKEMYPLYRQKTNSICYNESDFVQVHMNTFRALSPFLECSVTQLDFNDSYSKFKSLKVREERVQPTENYAFFSTAKHHASSWAAWSRFTCSLLHQHSMYCHSMSQALSVHCIILKRIALIFINSVGLVHSTKLYTISSFL